MSGSSSTTEPAPAYAFQMPLLDPVQVPPGDFPIEVAQFWRGEHSRGRPLSLHWSILVHTSPGRANCHEIVGDKNTYATQARFDVPLPIKADDWRGSHVVGFVSPDRMDDLLNRVALVPVVRHRWTWNCQNWVFEVLKKINGPGIYVDVNLTFLSLQSQMNFLLEAWEVGDI